MTRGATIGFVLSLAGASYLLASPFVAGLFGVASISFVIGVILLWATSHLLSPSNDPKWPAIVIALSVVILAIQVSSLVPSQNYYDRFGSSASAGTWQIPGSILALAGGVTSLFATRAPSPGAVALGICPKCKARIPVDAKFCAECGADLKPKTV